VLRGAIDRAPKWTYWRQLPRPVRTVPAPSGECVVLRSCARPALSVAGPAMHFPCDL
jgi:hypothetical protein